MNTFSKIILSSVVGITSIFTGVEASASTHLACGSNSFVIGSDVQNTYMMFHNGGDATFTHNGNKFEGTWWWSGEDAVTHVNGQTNIWSDVRYQECDFNY